MAREQEVEAGDINMTTDSPAQADKENEECLANLKSKDAEEEKIIDVVERAEEPMEIPNLSLGDTSPSTSQPTPKRRKLDKHEKEAERLRREEEKRQREAERLKKEEEKRQREQERLEKLRLKEEERVKREEEKRVRDEEKKRKDEEKEQERLKREEERKAREEEKKAREDERKRKEDERKQERLKKEEEKRKKDEERQKIELEKKLKQEKQDEKKQKQIEFMSKFLKITPPPNKCLNSSSKSVETTDTSPESGANDAVEKLGTSPKRAKSPDVIDLEDPESENIKTIRPGRNLLNQFNSSFQGRISDTSFKPMPFQVKIDMALAPTVRRSPLTPQEKSQLDQTLKIDEATAKSEEAMDVDNGVQISSNAIMTGKLYWNEEISRQKRKSERTEVKRVVVDSIPDNEVEILNDKGEVETPIADTCVKTLMEYHFKLLQFHENRRPAYWGTWKTKPTKLNPRRPFHHEEGIDYEFDSDDEWEDEPEDGEDLKSEKQSDDESSEEKKGEEDDDDEEGWMVPHGYLSDDERGDADPEIGAEKQASAEVVEHKVCDKDALKKQEEAYYKEITLDKKLGLPYIQTDKLSAYAMILYTKKKERRMAKRNAATQFNKKLHQGLLISEGCESSDEEDNDWADDESSDCDGDSDSSGEEIAEEEEQEDLKEERSFLGISESTAKVMDTT